MGLFEFFDHNTGAIFLKFFDRFPDIIFALTFNSLFIRGNQKPDICVGTKTEVKSFIPKNLLNRKILLIVILYLC